MFLIASLSEMVPACENHAHDNDCMTVVACSGDRHMFIT